MVQNFGITIPTINMQDLYAETESFVEIPLTALSRNTLCQLSSLLNPPKILRSEEGYERDWRGLAVLIQEKSYREQNSRNHGDPMAELIKLWCAKHPKEATFAKLQELLGMIDRWDVSDDIYENLVVDAKTYKAKRSSAISRTEEPPTTLALNSNDFGRGSDLELLTTDDIEGQPPQMYDAFLLFADADIEYAKTICEKLETNPNNFKLCDKNKLLAGVAFIHEALTRLIDERCKHLIVILTEEFFKSPENQFLVTYTHAQQIQDKKRKIIPLNYGPPNLELPKPLKILTQLRYNPNDEYASYFWNRLAASIRNGSAAMASMNHMKLNTTTMCNGVQHNTIPEYPPVTKDVMNFKVDKLPSPPTPMDIPSININGKALVEDDDIVKPIPPPREKVKKPFSFRSTIANKLLSSKSFNLRNAHSTSQLNTSSFTNKNSSLSDLSVASTCSEVEKKKKKLKFPKLFSSSRKSLKLQEV